MTGARININTYININTECVLPLIRVLASIFDVLELKSPRRKICLELRENVIISPSNSWKALSEEYLVFSGGI